MLEAKTRRLIRKTYNQENGSLGTLRVPSDWGLDVSFFYRTEEEVGGSKVKRP